MKTRFIYLMTGLLLIAVYFLFTASSLENPTEKVQLHDYLIITSHKWGKKDGVIQISINGVDYKEIKPTDEIWNFNQEINLIKEYELDGWELYKNDFQGIESSRGVWNYFLLRRIKKEDQ